MASSGGSGAGRPALPLRGGILGGFRTYSWFQIVLLLMALAAGGIGGYFGFTQIYESQNKPATTVPPTRVVRTTIRNTVAATGSITATQQSNLTFQASGTGGGKITDIFVRPGDVVQVDQPIAALDARSTVIARDQAQSALTSAQAKLDALVAGATPDVVEAARQAVAQGITGVATAQNNTTTASNNVTTAQTALAKTQNDLTALLEGPLPTDIEIVQAGVNKALSDLNIAQANYDKLVSHSDLVSRIETTAVATAKQNYQNAQASYLAKLTPPLTADVAQAQTNVKIARDALQAAQLRNLQVQADPTAGISDKLAAHNQVTAAQAQLDAAQSNLQKLQQGTDQADLAAAQSQVDNARTALAAAQSNYNNLVALSDLATRPETAALAQAKSAYDTAKAAYDAKLAPPRDTDLSTARAAVQGAQAGTSSAASAVNGAQATIPSAQASLVAAQAKLAQTLAGALPTDVTQAVEAITTARLALQSAQLNLDNNTLRAPFAGTIISVPAHIGDLAGSTTVIAALVNPQALEVDANVDETSVTQLRAGQQATVTLDALPGRTFTATVAAVTPSGTTQQGVVVFPIVFTLNTQGQPVPAGASANITVVTATTANVLAVPSRFVRRQGADQVVDVLVGNKRVTQKVTTGVTNGQLTEIRSGLQQGDLALPPAQAQRSNTFGAGGNVGGGGPPAP